MKLLLSIALRQLLERKRQSFVSLLGIILGVGFFLAVAGLMQGSERDFVKRLVDNSPHITIYDEYRNPKTQPAVINYPKALVDINNLKPSTETRGIRGYEKIIEYLASIGTKASPVLVAQGLVNFAGKNSSITLNGMIPNEIDRVSTIGQYMIEGKIEDLTATPDGIIIGAELARVLSLKRGNNISVASATGNLKSFKIVGIFKTGRSNYDGSHCYIHLKRAQSLMNRINRANNIIIKIPNPYTARAQAQKIENQIGYKSVSWQEASEDLINTLAIRNRIMYSVVSAVLIVAAFGIYNVISTVVMEKYRDIAILKSMGFYASDIQKIFISQGIILGIFGCIMGIPLGMLMMKLLMRVKFKPPGSSQVINMPIDWGINQFLIAIAFAMFASILASYLPARKAAKVQPVDILRGGSFLILTAENLSKSLAGEVPVTLVQNVSLGIEAGEFITINGPSGSGKSSLLYLLGLLDRPSKGRVILNKTDTSILNEQQLADLRIANIGFVFQFHFLIPEFSAIENVILPMQRLGKLKEAEMKTQAEELLVNLGLKNEINKKPKQLSGGQSQRVAIARALANKPILILADEPTGNLDTKSTANVQEIFKTLTKSSNTAIVTVSHDPTFTKICDRVITIIDGKLSS